MPLPCVGWVPEWGGEGGLDLESGLTYGAMHSNPLRAARLRNIGAGKQGSRGGVCEEGEISVTRLPWVRADLGAHAAAHHGELQDPSAEKHQHEAGATPLLASSAPSPHASHRCFPRTLHRHTHT